MNVIDIRSWETQSAENKYLIAMRFVCKGMGRQIVSRSANLVQCLCGAYELGDLAATKLESIAIIQCYNLQLSFAFVFQIGHQTIISLSFGVKNSFIYVPSLGHSLTNYRIRINCTTNLCSEFSNNISILQILFITWPEQILSIFHIFKIKTEHFLLQKKWFACNFAESTITVHR